MKWLVAFVLVLVLSACGDADDDPVAEPTPGPTTETSEPVASPTASATSTPTPSVSPTPVPTPTEDEPSEPAPAPTRPPASGDLDLNDAKLPQFNAVQGTITCLFEDFEGVQVRCDVMDAKWAVERPVGCDEAYGDSATLGAAPLLTCHGDTIFSPDVTHVLKEGKTAAFGDIVCRARSTSVICENGDDRAFAVSKADVSLR